MVKNVLIQKSYTIFQIYSKSYFKFIYPKCYTNLYNHRFFVNSSNSSSLFLENFSKAIFNFS